MYCMVHAKMLLRMGRCVWRTNVHDFTGSTISTGQGDCRSGHYCCMTCSHKIKHKLKWVAQLRTSLCWDFRTIAHLTDVAPVTVLIKNTLPGQTRVVRGYPRVPASTRTEFFRLTHNIHTSRCKSVAKCTIVSCIERKLLWTWSGNSKSTF